MLPRGAVPKLGRKWLIIGYGNTLRSDDGAGVRVVEAIAKSRLPGVATLRVHQLAPEIAEAIAGVDVVLFVDARLAEVGEDLAIARIQPAPSARPAAHTADPRSLLALAKDLYTHCPEAWLVAVPAVDVSMGETLSPTAARGVEAACEEIRRLIVGASS